MSKFLMVAVALLATAAFAKADSVKEQIKLYDVKTQTLAPAKVTYTTICDGNTCRRVAVPVQSTAANDCPNGVCASGTCTTGSCSKGACATGSCSSSGKLQLGPTSGERWVPFAKLKAAFSKLKVVRGGCGS
jgi:hypothetical protein